MMGVAAAIRRKAVLAICRCYVKLKQGYKLVKTLRKLKLEYATELVSPELHEEAKMKLEAKVLGLEMDGDIVPEL